MLKWQCKLRVLAFALTGLLMLTDLLSAQTGGQKIFTLNQENLFIRSEFGQRVRQDVAVRSAAIEKENRAIETELKAEELELTETRPDLTPAEFRELADAFNEKVEAIRKTQAQKSADLAGWADSEQRRFFEAAFPILLELAGEIGASVILDQRSTIISSDKIDITDQAIQRINQTIGDGSDMSEQ